MTITESGWKKYIERLRKINNKAAEEMAKQLENIDFTSLTHEQREQIIDIAYRISRRYGEASAALACEMYDALADLSEANVDLAEPAEPATRQEVGKTVNGTLKLLNAAILAAAVGRLVKMAGEDTILKNAIRDGAEYAWIPAGMTCAFCVSLAANGWDRASKASMKDGHAKHIHSNCDCAYAVRFKPDTKIKGYEPETYREQFSDAAGRTKKQKINSMRRTYYEENREKILEQKKTAYERSKALEASTAEETET